MKLYIVKATYDKGKVKNIPFNFYVIAEDELEASDKISEAISDSPEEMQNWYLATEPEEIASNECSANGDLIIQ